MSEPEDLELLLDEADARDVLISWAGKAARVMFRRDFAHLAAGKRPNRNAGLLLSQIVWLTHLSRARRDVVVIDRLAWVVRTRDEWGEDVGMSARTVERLLDLLTEKRLIVRLIGISPLRDHRGARVTHVRPDSAEIVAGLKRLEIAKRDRSPRQIVEDSVPETAPAGPLFLGDPVPETGTTPSPKPVGVEPPNGAPLTWSGESQRVNIREGEADDDSLLASLLSEGIARPEALRLLRTAGREVCERQLAAWRQVWMGQGKQIGYLIRAICEDWPEPPQLAEIREREARGAHDQAEGARRLREAKEREDRRQAAIAELERVWEGMTEEQRAVVDQEAAGKPGMRFVPARKRASAVEAERWRILADRRDIEMPEEA